MQMPIRWLNLREPRHTPTFWRFRALVLTGRLGDRRQVTARVQYRVMTEATRIENRELTHTHTLAAGVIIVSE